MNLVALPIALRAQLQAHRRDRVSVLLRLQAPFAVEAYVVSETTLEEVFVEVSLRADRKAVQF